MNVKLKDKIELGKILETNKAKSIEWVVEKLKLGYVGHLARGMGME